MFISKQNFFVFLLERRLRSNKSVPTVPHSGDNFSSAHLMMAVPIIFCEQGDYKYIFSYLFL